MDKLISDIISQSDDYKFIENYILNKIKHIFKKNS